MKRILIGASLFLIPATAAAAPPERPLYDLFQSLCVATKADPELIAKAIKMGDFQPHERAMPSLRMPGMQMGGRAWDFVIGTHKFSVNATHGTQPYGPAMIANSDACTVTAWGEDKASLVALNEWLGGKGGPGALARLDFTFEGSNRVPLNDQTVKAATDSGRAWTATVTDFSSGGSAMLVHVGVPYARP